MTNLPHPMGLDQLADMLATAQHYTLTDVGATSFYQGQRANGSPFLIVVNTIDGLGFAMNAAPGPRMVAANDAM